MSSSNNSDLKAERQDRVHLNHLQAMLSNSRGICLLQDFLYPQNV